MSDAQLAAEIAALDRMRRRARRPLFSQRQMIARLASGTLPEDERRALRAERRDLYARQQAVKSRGECASRLASMAPAYAAIARAGR